MEIKEQTKQIKDMVNSYKLSYIIISANSIGLFNCLNNESKTLLEISKELRIEPNRIGPILNALVFYELVEKEDNGYYLNKYNDVINKDSKYNQLGYIDFAQTIIKKYEKLEDIILNEDLSEDNFKELTEEGAESFMKGMEANAIAQAKYIAENYKFEGHNILDIGAGAGTYLVTVAKEYSTVKGKMIDLAQMVKIQNKRIENEKLQERIISQECDYNVSFPTEKYDDVFLFAVVHQEPIENVKKLLKNIYNILKPNGRLFLTSFFLNEDKVSPKFAVEFAVEMLLNSKRGKAYTHNEIQNLIKESGFNKFHRVEDIPSPATLYVIEK